VPALAALAAVVLRLDALRAPFFADDWLFLDQARGRSLFSTLASRDPIGNFFRPLGRQAWYWTLGRVSGESPIAFHAANLLLLAACVVLLWVIARRAAGDRAAAVAAAVLALSQAADVPVHWAAGCQDLLATTLALGAIALAQAGRLPLAALLLLLAPLAKEPGAMAVVPALMLARRDGESWSGTLRRAWLLPAAGLAWAAIATAMLFRQYGPANDFVRLSGGPVAALAGLARTALGLEWRTGGLPWMPPAWPTAPALFALALVLAGTLLASSRGAAAPGPRHAAAPIASGAAAPARPPRGASRGALWAGLAWAVAAALPIAPVARIWSSYFYLFAIGGIAFAAGAMVARSPRALAAALVALLGFAAQQARDLREFATAPSAWSGQSHVNRWYLDRGMDVVTRCVADLRLQHPSMPPRSTLFFAGLPSFVGVQAGDGALVRGVYRDTTLRSYFITRLRRDAALRGPLWFLYWSPETRQLIDRTTEPRLMNNLAIGFLLDDHPAIAEEALALASERQVEDPATPYMRGLIAAERGDTVSARAQLSAAGYAWARRGGDGGALARLAAGDTAGARALAQAACRRAVLDPAAHLALSRVNLAVDSLRTEGVVEGFAARALAPRSAAAWRHWGELQLRYGRNREAVSAITRYFALDPGAEGRDSEAVALREEARRRMPGGVAMQRALAKSEQP
jgi:hypothetical protein